MYEPYIRALIGTAFHFCKAVVLKSERFLSQEGEWGAVNDELRHIHVAADAQDALHSARLREVPITHLIVSLCLVLELELFCQI